MLWDRQTKRIVSNSDDDIMRMFETEFDAFGDASLDLYPRELWAEIDALNERIYETVNNGVYRCRLRLDARRLRASAVAALFATLDELEARLATRRYLVRRARRSKPIGACS